MSSVITLAVAVGVQDRPAAAPKDGPWESGFRVVASPPFFDGVAALGAAVFSFAGAPNFLNIVAEMRNPRDYPRALVICQIFTLVTYLIIGSVVYHFCEAYVASPALGSAGPLMKKVCYGLALPGLIVSAVLCTHFPGKFLFVRLMRNSKHFARNTIPHRLAWGGCVIGSAVISFIIAEAVPVFSDLLSILGSLISIPLAIGIESWIYIWLCPKQGRRLTPWTYAVYGLNVFIVLVSAMVALSGLVGACISVRNHVKSGQMSVPFSCGDNSI
ncbi:hypothetical protein CspeluHIS016_0212020 [Cutaneotrichosporon spelunceum]|uniref:Amino acid transporter transmembrane domain-containing protein n=1 Tax=Cutaneotrichosporon spelunceum TaxID=1672016 RepID=A0AAD3TTF0_9TREE|nr:hypothetical protein CspeluHIS016_0212020 [Cutaneotrichosporon spelunceum]